MTELENVTTETMLNERTEKKPQKNQYSTSKLWTILSNLTCVLGVPKMGDGKTIFKDIMDRNFLNLMKIINSQIRGSMIHKHKK